MSDKSGLRRSALKLGLAGAIEYGLQFAMPVILVRCLSPLDFAQYRLLWLLSATMLALAPAFMPNSLFYFLPRVDGAIGQARIIGNILLYLLLAALVTGLILSPLNPWLPLNVQSMLRHSQGLATLFLMLWLVSALFDTLPTAELRSSWQASATIGMAILRTLVLGLAAWLTQDVRWVLLGLVLLALIKLGLLAHYLWRAQPGRGLGLDRALMRQQWRYVLPFALGNALFLLRQQADQWVVATLMAPALYASFSIATVLQPVATLLRQPVYNAMMPHLNAAYAKGELERIRHLITHCNAATAMLLLPVASLFWLCAPEMVEIMYKKQNMAAAPVMRVYLIGMMVNAFAIGHVLPALNLGRFNTLNNGVVLLCSVALSLAGVHWFGLPGAALGSVLGLAISEFWSATVVAGKLQISVATLLSWRKLWPTLASSGVALVLAMLISSRLAWLVWPLVLAKGTLFVLFWLPCFLAMGGRAQLRTMRKFD